MSKSSGWRHVALVLSQRLNTPMPTLLSMPLGEAAEWMKTIRDANDAERTQIETVH